MSTNLITKGQAHAEEFIRHGVETWVDEGHIDRARAAELASTLNAPEVEAGMLHLGAHFAISLPLRFPFGALARFFYTLGLRLRAEANALLRRGSAREARRMHTFVVMLVSLLPGFGRLGYFFAPALRDERLLLVIPLDQASRKLPFRVYSRLHLDALFLYWGLGDDSERRHTGWRSLRQSLGARLDDLRPYAMPIVAMLAIDSVILLIGGYLYLESGQQKEPPIWWFSEGGMMAILDGTQLLLAAALGVVTYFGFWRLRPRASRSEAAGIFLWGTGGIGLAIFAFDDFFTVHERLGTWIIETFDFIPVITNIGSDMLVVSYGLIGVLVILTFRMEVFSPRPSATLLQFAAAASLIMVLVDGFATADALKALEFPAQVYACTLLLSAFAVRWLEVRQVGPASNPVELCGVSS